MTGRSNPVLAIAIVPFFLVATSCNREQRINEDNRRQTDSVLRLMMSASHAYIDRNGRCPTSLQDLTTFVAEDWDSQEAAGISKHDLRTLHPLLLKGVDGWGTGMALQRDDAAQSLLVCSAGADRVHRSSDDICVTIWFTTKND